jgi:HEPN domain-containing protein
MKRITNEWLRKAEKDFSTMIRESKVEIDPNADAITFHAQQCAEKYLKGYLQEKDIKFPKSHDLSLLLELATTDRAEFKALGDECDFLTDFAIESRYPGEDPTKEDSEQAITSCKHIRKLIRELLSPTDQMTL